jgi:hypothetical protein
MEIKYINKEISMLARMEQLEAISQQGLDKLKEFRYLRDLHLNHQQSLPIDNVSDSVCLHNGRKRSDPLGGFFCIECDSFVDKT